MLKILCNVYFNYSQVGRWWIYADTCDCVSVSCVLLTWKNKLLDYFTVFVKDLWNWNSDGYCRWHKLVGSLVISSDVLLIFLRLKFLSVCGCQYRSNKENWIGTGWGELLKDWGSMKPLEVSYFRYFDKLKYSVL